MGKRPRGPQPDWQPTSARQRGIVADLIDRYEQHRDEGTLPRGPRGIFYDLRPNGMGHSVTYTKPTMDRPIKKPMEAHPQDVQDALVLARRAGIIPEPWVADGRAVDGSVPIYDASVEAFVDDGMAALSPDNFELDRQAGQPVFIEVLCEAADLVPRLSRVAAGFGVPVYTGSGFDGLKAKRAMGERAIERERPTIVLHVGDRDKHGDAIYVAAGEDAVGWAGVGNVLPAARTFTAEKLQELRDVVVDRSLPARVVFIRLALTTDQADELGLLDEDGKAEVNAVPVQVMDAWDGTPSIEVLRVDLKNGRLHVRRSYDGPTKGRRSRTISISPDFVACLAAWYEESVIEQGAAADGFVWPGKVGGPMHEHTPTQTCTRAMTRAGLVDAEGTPLVTLHGLRHTCASLMLMKGVPLIVVSRHLGHANMNITARVCAHLVDDAQLGAAADAFQSIFDGGADTLGDALGDTSLIA